MNIKEAGRNTRGVVQRVVLVGALVLGGCKSSDTPIFPCPTPELVSPSLPTENEMVDFISKSLPFAMKIPPDWNNGAVSDYSFSPDSRTAVLQIRPDAYIAIGRIDIPPENATQSMEEWAQRIASIGGIKIKNKCESTIDNRKALKIDSEITDKNGKVLRQRVDYLFEGEETNELWSVSLGVDSREGFEKDLPNFEKTLRTFRLTHEK